MLSSYLVETWPLWSTTVCTEHFPILKIFVKSAASFLDAGEEVQANMIHNWFHCSCPACQTLCNSVWEVFTGNRRVHQLTQAFVSQQYLKTLKRSSLGKPSPNRSHEFSEVLRTAFAPPLPLEDLRKFIQSVREGVKKTRLFNGQADRKGWWGGEPMS